MKVKIKKLNKAVVVPFKKHDDDFCNDVVAVSEEEIAPNVWKYGLGLACQIERDFEPLVLSTCYNGGKEMIHKTMMDFSRSPLLLSIDLRPRSSVWETGMILSNCEGTIDEGYTGEVSAVFYHVMPNMPRYRVGDKIGQIKIGVTLPVEFEVVDELDSTTRGAKGYGSTGKKA